jgi:hypothetical protein
MEKVALEAVAAAEARILAGESEEEESEDEDDDGEGDSFGSGGGSGGSGSGGGIGKKADTGKNKIPSSYFSGGGGSNGDGGSGIGGNGSGGGSSMYVPGSDLFQPRSKKARLLVPAERKAFFSVVSLLTEVPEHVRLSEATYEAYVPARHKKLLASMKAAFFYSC